MLQSVMWSKSVKGFFAPVLQHAAYWTLSVKDQFQIYPQIFADFSLENFESA